MKICLVRHGEPDFNRSFWIERNNTQGALKRYEKASVSLFPPDAMRDDLLAPQFCVVSSELLRARQSALLLGFKFVETSPLLNESRLPHPDALPFRMPWSLVLALCRSAWVLGYRKNADGLRVGTERANSAASWLNELALKHGEVNAFGHGIMNRLIARSLIARGWKKEYVSGRGYWSSTVMYKGQ